ncbi:MAG: metallophosphoesterase [Defluviitaleaceae bacterium]|nr:metallophosphoesterase [Defluviitaleaceae bacterium]MCL2262116.1 metallophosphoesterase [Defluviitaleaceae bacterium]
MKRTAVNRKSGTRRLISFVLVFALVASIVPVHFIVGAQQAGRAGGSSSAAYDAMGYPIESEPFCWLWYHEQNANVTPFFTATPELLWSLADHADVAVVPPRTAAALHAAHYIFYNHTGTHTASIYDGVFRTDGRTQQFNGLFVNFKALGMNLALNEYTVTIRGYLDGTIGTGHNFRILGENPPVQFADFHNFGVYATGGAFDVTLTLPSAGAGNNWRGTALRIETNAAAAATDIVIEELVIYRTLGVEQDFFRALNLIPGGSVNEMRFSWHMPFETGYLRIYEYGETTPVQTIATTGRETTYRMGHPWFFGHTAQTQAYYIHQIAVEGLRADGYYEYVIAGTAIQTTRIPFRTGTEGDSFQFLVMGDPQLGVASTNRNRDRDAWHRTVSRSMDLFPDTAFMLLAGDQVNTNNQAETRWGPQSYNVGAVQWLYDALFDHPQLNSVPIVPIVGNHDTGVNNLNQFLWHDNYFTPFDAPNIRRHGGTRVVRNICITCFDIPAADRPDNCPQCAVFAQTRMNNLDYYMRVGNTLFIVLDSNTYNMTTGMGQFPDLEYGVAARVDWIKDVAYRHNDATWKVAAFHFPMYSGYRSMMHAQWPRDHQRAHWTPILQDIGIDVVLTAHDHAFSRTHQMYNNAPQLTQQWINAAGVAAESNVPTSAVLNPTGIVHFSFNQASGSNFRNVRHTTNREYLAAYNQNFRLNFTVVDVTENTFSISTYQINDDGVTTSLVDVYTIVKGSVPSGFTPRQPQEHIFERTLGAPASLVPTSLTEADLTAENLSLPATFGVQTDLLSQHGTVYSRFGGGYSYYSQNAFFGGRGRPLQVPVEWDLASIVIPAPDAQQPGQTFTVYGEVQLPNRGVVNPASLPVDVSAIVTFYDPRYVFSPELVWQMSACDEVAAWTIGDPVVFPDGAIHSSTVPFARAGNPTVTPVAGAGGRPVALHITERLMGHYTVDVFVNHLPPGNYTVTVIGRTLTGLGQTDSPWGGAATAVTAGGVSTVTHRFDVPLVTPQRGFRINGTGEFFIDDVIIEEWDYRFVPSPATGIPDVSAPIAAMFALMATSAVLWAVVIRRRKTHGVSNA